MANRPKRPLKQVKAQRKNAAPVATEKQPQFHVVGKTEPATGVKKLSLGGLVKTAEKKSASSPALTLSEESRALLEQFVAIAPKFKELEKQMKGLKAQIAPAIKGDYFAQLAGTSLDGSSMSAVVSDENVKLVFKNSYSTLCADDAPLVGVLGAELVARHFRQVTKLTLDLDKVAEEKQEAFVNAVINAAQELGITDGISAKQCIQPRAGFHAARTSLLTPEQNVAVDAIIPLSAYPQI